MEIENILDHNTPENKEKKFFLFQMIEFALVAIFCTFLLFDVTGIQEIVILLQAGIFVFMLVRIYFEYKNELTTGIGVLLRLILVLNAAVILIGIEFKVANWPYASEMIIVGLSSMGFPYMFYAVTLKDVSIPIKIILFLNSFFLTVFALGLLFSMENWPNAQSMLTSGGILTVFSLFAFAYIWRINPNQKEWYHSLTYLARTVAFLVFGYLTLS